MAVVILHVYFCHLIILVQHNGDVSPQIYFSAHFMFSVNSYLKVNTSTETAVLKLIEIYRVFRKWKAKTQTDRRDLLITFSVYLSRMFL
jgi:hypothetical protein